MPVVPLACPLCAGLIQIDTLLAGQQVACPLCHGVLTVPPPGVASLACPICGGPFQISLAMAGQQVGCPHCGSPVTVPALEQPRSQPVDPLSRLPPGGRAEAPAPRAKELEPASRLERLPPGFAPRKTESAKSESAPPQDRATPPSERLPTPRPAAAASDRKPPSDRLPPPARPAVPSEDAHAPQQPKQPVEEAPPATAAIDDLLPPGAASLPMPQTDTPPEPSRPALVDALLPPGAITDGATTTTPGEQVAIPAAPQRAPIAMPSQPAGTIALPTPDGGFVALKETPKTIVHGDEEIEVRRLTPQEKAARRFRRNLILGCICIAILAAVMAFFLW